MVISLGSDTSNENDKNYNATRARVRHPIGGLIIEDLKANKEWITNIKACENSLRELTKIIRKNTEATKKLRNRQNMI